MGTKRPNGTVFDTLSNINTSDRKLQPGGKVSLDPSPRTVMSAKLEQGRDGSREEDWRREREMEKSRDKVTYRDPSPRERYYERDRGPVPRQRERSDRERWPENDRRQNLRPLSNLEKDTDRDAVRGMKKGDTFPRMRRNSGDRDRRAVEVNDESGGRRRRERPKRLETDDWEREYEREQQRERYRDEVRGRVKEDGQRRRERDDSWERKERDTARKREKPRADMGKREHRGPSPYRQRDREVYLDRVDRKPAQRKDGQRDTKSEGDSDDREKGRERVRQRDREYHHSRSDGDGTGKPKRDRDRQGYRDEDRYRYRDRDRKREADLSRRRDVEKDRERYRDDPRNAAREADREGERWKDSNRDLKDDRRRYDTYREPKQERHRERNEKEEERRWDDSTARAGRVRSDAAPRAAPRAQSSGEWSTTDVEEQRSADAERSRRGQDRERRGQTEQRRMWLEPQRGKNSKGNVADRDTGTRERNIESQCEWGSEEQRAKEEPDEHYLDRYTERHGNRGSEAVGVSVDGDMYEVWREKGHGEGEQMSDSDRGNTEESDREEEGGSDDWARSESEGGSDAGWKQEKDRILSGEDDFVTISSSGDEQDEREEDEERYEDCQEYLDGGVKDPSPGDLVGHDGEKEHDWRTEKDDTVDEDDHGSGKHQKYVFCVVGQTLPRKKTGEKAPPEAGGSPGEDTGDPSSTRGHQGDQRASAQEDEREMNLESDERMRGKSEPPQTDTGQISRDSLTERLLMEWRQKNNEPFDRETEKTFQVPENPYDDVYSQMNFEQIQPILEELSSGMMSPEEVEAIRIRLSGAWTLSEEPKQHCQAPHLKWAKNVVREILGKSEDQTVDEIAAADGDGRVNQAEDASVNVRQQVEASRETPEVPVDLRTDAQHSDAELDLDESLELEGLRGMGQSHGDMHADQVTAMHGDARTHTHADGKEEHGVDEENSPSGQHQLDRVEIVVEKSGNSEISEADTSSREEEADMYLSVSNTLYKPSSCPILSCETGSESLVSSSEGEDKQVDDRTGESEEDREEEERDVAEEMGEGEASEPDGDASGQYGKRATVKSSCSFRDLGPRARLRRRGVRKTTERKAGEHVDVKEEEGVGRDRRTRIFSATGKDGILEMKVHSSVPFNRN